MIGDERVINLPRTKVYVFSNSVLCLGKILENHPIERCMGRQIGMVELQLSQEVQELLLRLHKTPENFTGRIIFMSMFNDISCVSKDNEKECMSSANLVSLYAKRLEKDNGHSLVLVPRKSGLLSVKIVHKVNGTKWWKGCSWNSQKADVQFSVLQVHCPEVDLKAKDMKNCRYTTQPIWTRFKLFFA